MGRPVRPELIGADIEARRWVMYILADAATHGYPSKAAFAKEIARGAISLPPTPDDPSLEAVGRYINMAASEIVRRVIMAHYGDADRKSVKARRLSMTINRWDRTVERFLLGLNGYMIAAVWSEAA